MSVDNRFGGNRSCKSRFSGLILDFPGLIDQGVPGVAVIDNIVEPTTSAISAVVLSSAANSRMIWIAAGVKDALRHCCLNSETGPPVLCFPKRTSAST